MASIGELLRERGQFICPKCGKVSHHPRDLKEGYCAGCAWWTGVPGNSLYVTIPFEEHDIRLTIHFEQVSLWTDLHWRWGRK